MRKLLEVLVCPKCKGELRHDPGDEVLVCEACRLAYGIEEGVPNMLVEEAEEL